MYRIFVYLHVGINSIQISNPINSAIDCFQLGVVPNVNGITLLSVINRSGAITDSGTLFNMERRQDTCLRQYNQIETP